MYTIDASVWVNAFDEREPGHNESRKFLDLLREKKIPIVVPNLVCIEVAGAISRTRAKPREAEEFATALRRLPNTTVRPLDEALEQQALELAVEHALRGADAVYAAVALESSTILVTLDREHLTRLANLVPARTPIAVLAELQAPAESPVAAPAAEDAQTTDEQTAPATDPEPEPSERPDSEATDD